MSVNKSRGSSISESRKKSLIGWIETIISVYENISRNRREVVEYTLSAIDSNDTLTDDEKNFLKLYVAKKFGKDLMKAIKKMREREIRSGKGKYTKADRWKAVEPVAKEIYSVMLKNRAAVLIAPTDWGKSLVMHYVAEQLKKSGRVNRVIVVEPTRALVSEKYRRFKEEGYKVAMIDKDHPKLDYYVRRSDIIVSTYFKLATLLSDYIDEKTLIVFDEVHRVLDSPELQIIIALARKKKPYLLSLSATLIEKQLDILTSWMKAYTKYIKEEHRVIHYHPILIEERLDEIIRLDDRKSYPVPRGKEGEKLHPRINLILDVVREILSKDPTARIMIFFPFRRYANSTAKELAEQLPQIIPEYIRSVDLDVKEYGLNALLKKVAQAGVLIHHGGLMGYARKQVEEALENGDFNVVVSCFTLTEGVNIPIDYLILPSLDGIESATKFTQLVGRVGRCPDCKSIVIPILNELEYIYFNERLKKAKADPKTIKLPDLLFTEEVIESIMAHYKDVDMIQWLLDNSIFVIAYPDKRHLLEEVFDRAIEELVRYYPSIEINEDGTIVIRDKNEELAMKLSMAPVIYEYLKSINFNPDLIDWRELVLKFLDYYLPLIGIEDDKIKQKIVQMMLESGYNAPLFTIKYRFEKLKDIIASELEKVMMFFNRVYRRDKEMIKKVNIKLSGYYASNITEDAISLAIECGASIKELRVLSGMVGRRGMITAAGLPSVLKGYYASSGYFGKMKIAECIEEKMRDRVLEEMSVLKSFYKKKPEQRRAIVDRKLDEIIKRLQKYLEEGE